MQRRDFLRQTSLAAIGTSLGTFAFGKSCLNSQQIRNNQFWQLAKTSDKLEFDFQQLLQWLKDNGWAAYLTESLRVNFDLQGNKLKEELLKELDKDKLSALRIKSDAGFDDFAGNSLIKPGFPAYSLLYHALASPRVKSSDFKNYPTLEKIDFIENYIYALSDWEELKTDYGITSNKDLVLAVFAYEYRPAFKTPHHEHADIVFSRTGVARVGDEPLSYDAFNRCYINKPKDAAKVKQIAVTPARYAAFLAKKVSNKDIDLMKTVYYKSGDRYNDEQDSGKWFLQPIRKIFNNDLLVDSSKIDFNEFHKSEKLNKLFVNNKVQIENNIEPPILSSDYLIVQDAERNAGSSFLVIPKVKPLIRLALKDNTPLYFMVPKGEKFFNAYNTLRVEDVELLERKENNSGYWHNANDYLEPRNQPLFLNITHKKSSLPLGYEQLKRELNDNFENEIKEGGYPAPLFEDSICDGSVIVNTTTINFSNLIGISNICLPAFSIVTAPDFFPQVDSFDLSEYDVPPGNSNDSNFFEGGIATLSSARIKPNPKVLKVKDISTESTYTAVLSMKSQLKTGTSQQKQQDFKNSTIDKGYYVSSFLPDGSSSIFAPGWDVTYSSTSDGEIYIGTEGLGSPFTEDMKLCAAMNGMWPTASPDASRTYQGALSSQYRNPTAIPLLDDEIGFHKNSPRGDGFNCYGWDGEQGPFIQQIDENWYVNFTDLGRADVVQNTLDGNLDMSRLRELNSKELISRMTCLKMCIQQLPEKNFRLKDKGQKLVGLTYLWLVSAEKVNWGNEDVKAYGVPSNLVGNNKDWISKKENAKVQGQGYLFIFVDSDEDNYRIWADYKRRRLGCKNIYVCQVTENNIAWQEVLNNPLKWHFK
jgi:hypothetical protein